MSGHLVQRGVRFYFGLGHGVLENLILGSGLRNWRKMEAP